MRNYSRTCGKRFEQQVKFHFYKPALALELLIAALEEQLDGGLTGSAGLRVPMAVVS